jgi:hypothetical protein
VWLRLSKLLLVLALASSIGLHWATLQTVAWTAMLANNLRSDSFSEAVSKTFDGRHPCPLCKAVAAGKASEQKSEFTPPLKKFEFPPAAEKLVLIAPAQFQLLPLNDFFAESLTYRPPVPPPRTA